MGEMFQNGRNVSKGTDGQACLFDETVIKICKNYILNKFITLMTKTYLG